MKVQGYLVEIRPLSDKEGGGLLALFPDLPGCMADGESVESALVAAYDAATSWLATAREFGESIPEPGSGGVSRKFVARVPKSLHTCLVTPILAAATFFRPRILMALFFYPGNEFKP